MREITSNASRRGLLVVSQDVSDGFIWKKLFVLLLLMRASEEYSIVASLGMQWYASGNLTGDQYTQLAGR